MTTHPIAARFEADIAAAADLAALDAVRVAALAFAVLYAFALVAWPFIVADPAAMEGETPWLYYICTVATTAAVVALPTPIAAGYTIVVPAIYGVIRLLPAGGGSPPRLDHTTWTSLGFGGHFLSL